MDNPNTAVSLEDRATSEPEKFHSRLALVLPGGGARAAYQAGVLRGIGQHFPHLHFPILTGVSAGAINAVYLASQQGSLAQVAEAMCQLWSRIELDDVFRIDLACLARNSLSWASQLALGTHFGSQQKGLMDTEPLRQFLRKELKCTTGIIPGIAENIEQGLLEAIALMTVNYGTGQTVSWFQGRGVEAWERPERIAINAPLTVEHVMASAALPLIFPAVKLGDAWFGDGGIRLSAPLSPALHMGADRILAISTRYARSQTEADKPSFSSYPSPAQIAGNMLNAVFLDVLDQDVQRLERLNDMVTKLPPEDRQGFKPIDILVLRPSQDLGKMSAGFEPRLPKGFRFLTRNLGSRQTESPDFLSLLMFQPEYLAKLIELGSQDVTPMLGEIETLIHP